MTAPPERLVVMLYDGALRFLFQAAAAMREGARATASSGSTAARRSSTTCCDARHVGTARSPQRLEGIYVFCKRLLLEARLERDADKIDLVRGYLAELREAWAQIAGA